MNKLKDCRQARTVKILTGFVIMLLSFALVNTAFSTTSGTLVTNGGFETGSISPWRMSISGSGNVATLAITGDAYSGNYAGKISVTNCNTPSPVGYIAFNSPMLSPTVGEKYKLTFTYKASSSFEVFFLCETSTAQVFNKYVVCSASSVWKTISFDIGPIPSASKNWFTLRFNRVNTVTIDNISMASVDDNPAQTPTSTPIPTPSPTSSKASGVGSVLTNGDFEAGTTTGWRLYTVKNLATLTTTSDAYSGSFAGFLKVVSYSAPEPNGYVCLQHPFSATAGAKHIVSFKYKSITNFKVFVIAPDSAGKQYYWQLSCSASADWTTKTITTGNLPPTFSSANRPWIDFRFYSLGEAKIDDVSIVPAGTSTSSNLTPTPTPTPTSTSTITPTGTSPIFLRQSFMTEGWTSQEIVSNVDVCQAHYNGLGKMLEIKALRPDMLTFVYYNTAVVWGPGSSEYDAARLQLFKNNNWILKDSTGAYVLDKSGSCYIVDFGNPSYHTWLANWYKGYVTKHGLSGVSLDHWTTNYIIFYLTSQIPTNPRTGSTWTNQQICDAYKALCQKIQLTIGSDKLILVNGIFNGNHFYSYGIQYYQDAILNSGIDALMSEGWVSNYDANTWVSESIWLKSINYAVWLENNFPAAGGKYFMLVIGDNSWFTYTGTQGFPADMTEKQYEQFVTYCFASRYLTVKHLTTIVSLGGYIEKPYAQALFKIDIGEPTGDYYKIGNLYARQFTEGLVIVNPTSVAHQANIGAGYKNAVDGTSVSSVVTVQSHTGLILSDT